jgi:SpoVK/Ycf46/Vps4 family AAA+-type ATPase
MSHSDKKEETPSPDAEGLVERLATNSTWADLALAAAHEETLRSIALDARRRPSAAEKRPHEAGSTAAPLGLTALFVGPDSTAMTRAAEVLARELGRDLYRVDLGRITSKYIGETEKNLNRVLEAAEAREWVLLFDEADALFGKRTDVKDSHDRYANIEINYLLDRLEAFNGLAILATNLRSSLDPAFTRRLRYVVDLPRR